MKKIIFTVLFISIFALNTAAQCGEQHGTKCFLQPEPNEPARIEKSETEKNQESDLSSDILSAFLRLFNIFDLD